MSEISDILQKATQVFDTKGLCKNGLYNNYTGGVCTFGAINIALTGHYQFGNDEELLIAYKIGDVLYSHLPGSYKVDDHNPQGCIVKFNNDPHTIIDDVKDLFAKTIADEGISIDRET